MPVPDEVEAELRASFKKADLGGQNLSVVDSAAHACIRRVISRKGIAGYNYAYVWPVVSVTLLPGSSDERKFTFDVRELTKDE